MLVGNRLAKEMTETEPLLLSAAAREASKKEEREENRSTDGKLDLTELLYSSSSSGYIVA